MNEAFYNAVVAKRKEKLEKLVRQFPSKEKRFREAFASAANFKTKSDWHSFSSSDYQYLRLNGGFEEATAHMERKPKKLLNLNDRKQKASRRVKEATEAAKKYYTKADFAANERSLYNYLVLYARTPELGFADAYINASKHMVKSKDLTPEICISAARSCENLPDFYKTHPSVARKALDSGWMSRIIKEVGW